MATKKQYTTKLKLIKFDITDAEGRTAEYTMRELTGQARDSYLNANKDRVRQEGEGVKVLDYNNVYASLLSLCVYDPQGKLVPITTLQEWPADMQQQLHAEALELSGLNKEAKAQAKNG